MKRLAGACLLLLGAFLLAVFPASAAAPLAASDETYALSRGMLMLGEAHFQLTPDGGDGCWRYAYEARPQGLARMFIGRLREESRFCIVGGALRSSRFEYQRSDKPSDDFSLEFDWTARVVRSSRGDIRELKEDMTDRLGMQVVIQRWAIARQGAVGPDELSVTQVDYRRAKTYRFRIVGHETVDTPAGRFETVRVERVDNPKKSVRFWLAPSRGYTAVRFEQVQEGSEQLSLQLKK